MARTRGGRLQVREGLHGQHGRRGLPSGGQIYRGSSSGTSNQTHSYENDVINEDMHVLDEDMSHGPDVFQPCTHNVQSSSIPNAGNGPQQRTRGPNQGTLAPRDPSMRIPIGVRLGSFDNPSMSHALGTLMRGHFNEAWPSWSKVPRSTRDLWWQQFKDTYTWASEIDNVVSTIWKETSRDIFNGMLGDGRRDALQKSKKNSLSECLDHHPSWMRADLWEELVNKFWSGDKWKKKTEIGRANRTSTKHGGMSKHTGGSISAGAHHKKLEEELGEKPTFMKIYDRMHKRDKGSGEYVDEKSEIVAKKYGEAFINKYGDDGSFQQDIDGDLWVEATGGTCKGRVYGFGHRVTAKNVIGSHGSSSTCFGRREDNLLSSVVDHAYMEQRIQECVAAQSQINSQLLAQKIAEFEQRQHELQAERDNRLFAQWHAYYFP